MNEEQSVTHLCSFCQESALFEFRYRQDGRPAFVGDTEGQTWRYCQRCYEERRTVSKAEVRMQQMRRRHPEWEKRPDESSREYGLRMLKEMKRIHAENQAEGRGVVRIEPSAEDSDEIEVPF